MVNVGQPNILLIVTDTARAKTVLDTEEVMPNFHKLAKEGTLFTNAFSTAPWTLPSHASLFTGQYTSDHGTHAGNKEFDPDVPTLAERLQSSGYQTIGFSNNVWISSEFGFDRGFDKLRTNMQLVEGGTDLGSIAKETDGVSEQARTLSKTLLQRNGHRTLINGLYSKFLRGRYDDGARLTNWRIKRWLSAHENSNKPFFMFVNYLEPHLEYDPPKEFKYKFIPDGLNRSDLDSVNQDAWSYICNQRDMDTQDFKALSTLYKAELNYLDYRLGNIFRLLENEEVLDETLIVVVGDHGENLGDYGLMDHQYCLYDTLLHVPLLVRYPEQFPAGKECKELVEVRDIAPTLFRTAGIDPPKLEDISSHALQDVIESGGREYVISEYIQPQPSMEELERRTGSIPATVKKFDRGLRSIRTKQWKFIEGTDESAELYQVTTDPEETVNISEENEEQIEKLRQLLIDELSEITEKKSDSDDNKMKAETRKRLQDLGYL